MFKNHLKTAFRFFARHRMYSFINIAGLAVGMACVTLIALWIHDEVTYDTFNNNADNIYRIISEKDGRMYAPSPPPLAPMLKANVADVVDAMRYYSIRYISGSEWVVRGGGKLFRERHIAFADPAFFSIFTFRAVEGDLETALSDPNGVVITAGTAEKYFGTGSAVGQVLSIGNADAAVTAVIENVPVNSHLEFDFLFPFANLAETKDLGHWGDSMYFTYVLLRPGADIDGIEEHITKLRNDHYPNYPCTAYLQPLSNVHLQTGILFDIAKKGDIIYVYVFALIALFVLSISCINYMNLSTAQAGSRVCEIGIRKVVGADRFSLACKFITEAMLLSLSAILVSVMLVDLLLPSFNQLAGKEIRFDLLGNPGTILLVVGIACVTGFVSGLYPAAVLSSLPPSHALKTQGKSGTRNTKLRKALVLIQLVLSLVMIIGTSITYQQLAFIRARDLGYDHENLVYIPLTGEAFENIDRVKNELLANVSIENVTVSSDIPTSTIHHWGGIDWQGRSPDENTGMYVYTVDFDFIETLGIEMVSGRRFSRRFSTDSENYILNEAAAGMIGSGNPVGQWFDVRGTRGTIIGVMKDFNFKSLHSGIEPLVLRIGSYPNFLIIRAARGDVWDALENLENIWRRSVPEIPLEYHFLDTSFEGLYRSERRLGRILAASIFFAIIISCSGLYALSSFAVDRRRKEIGIRKVLGASTIRIAVTLLREFILLVLAAGLVACPVAYSGMNRWLMGFAYRVSIGAVPFVSSILLVLVVVVITVGTHVVMAARRNPVDSLRYE